jgi:hypothetical protein
MKMNPKILIIGAVVGIGLFFVLQKFVSDSTDSLASQPTSTGHAKSDASYNQKETLIADLRKRIADLENQLLQLEVEQSVAEGNYSLVNGKIDRKDLEKIKFPQNPTKENLKAYVFTILEVSKNQNNFSPDDFQVEMFKKLGGEDLDVLINLLDYTPNSRSYLMHAIKAMATEQHKELILKEVAQQEELLSIINKYGWQSGIKDLIIDKLERGKFARVGWAHAAAHLKDPEINPSLVKYFERADSPADVYHVISHVPEIQLSEEQIVNAWERVRFGGLTEATDMARIAINYGRIDALDLLIQNLDSPNLHHTDKKKMLESVYKSTGMSGSAEGLKQWYGQSKGRLIFDSVTRRFQVR